MHRLFVALRPPEPVRNTLIDAMEGLDGSRRQGNEQLHLTLRFVGEVDAPQANDLADPLRLVRAEPLVLRVLEVGHSAKKGRVSALWAASVQSEGLAALPRRVERACRAAGLPPETRQLMRHVTIARLNTGTGPIGDWLAEHFRFARKPTRSGRRALRDGGRRMAARPRPVEWS